MIEAWFDGGCYPINPGGTASYGIIVKQPNNSFKQSGIIGTGPEMSNNVAEYCGLIEILEYIERTKPEGDIIIYGDSQLVINQMSLKWKAKQGLYFKHYLKAKILLQTIPNSIKFVWIPREQNTECDSLAEGAVLNGID